MEMSFSIGIPFFVYLNNTPTIFMKEFIFNGTLN